MLAGMHPDIERMVKILELEREQGCRDRAVQGGLEAFAERWGEAAASSLPDLKIDRVTSALEGYGEQQETEREKGVINALRALRGTRGGGKQRDRGRSAGASAARSDRPVARSAAKPPAPAALDPGREHPPRDRPELDLPVRDLRGIGDKAAGHLARLELHSIRDLLLHLPARYRDFRDMPRIDQLEVGQDATVAATIWRVSGRRIGGNRHLLSLILSDTTGQLQVSYFNQPYLEKRFRRGQQIVVSGKVEVRAGRLTMSSPEWEGIDQQKAHTARMVPIYPLTEGIKQRWLRRQILQALERWVDAFGDPLPASLRAEHDLLAFPDALRELHFPRDAAHLERARRRLAFDDLLLVQLWAGRRRRARKSQPGVNLAEGLLEMRRFVDALPYELTRAEPDRPDRRGQREVIREIVDDLSRPEPMSRLLQGDVGCGKTAVAGAALALCVGAGHQGALMAPTEILAEQHFRSLLASFEPLGYRPFDPSAPDRDADRHRIARLVGSMSAGDKDRTAEALRRGEVELVVGTHAVIQDRVAFRCLGLAIVDEKHRFGVLQKAELLLKGSRGGGAEAAQPHFLLMTATPIPRSMKLAMLGDADVSVIETMPPGRKAIRSHLLSPSERARAHAFIRRRVLERGQQAYIVHPLVEESESIDARAAVESFPELDQEVFGDLEVGLLHGQLRPAEKEAVMRRFQAGEIDVLVATSVIEVGVDVPNATVMLIENAERFGLAQLHQFRGRVGRGSEDSTCLFISEARSESARKRLEALVEPITDPKTGQKRLRTGLELAKFDLDQRGPGDLFGLRQAGWETELRFAHLASTESMILASRVAERLMRDDPWLAGEGLAVLRERVDALIEARERI